MVCSHHIAEAQRPFQVSRAPAPHVFIIKDLDGYLVRAMFNYKIENCINDWRQTALDFK